MALPVVTRNWQFSVNKLVAGHASVDTQNAGLLLEIKNTLKGGGTGWTNRSGGAITPVGGAIVVGSSNTLAAGMDGVDRWATAANIIFSYGTARSWIVLQMFGGVHVMLDCYGSSNIVNAYASHTAFTGGSITAPPTSPNQVTLANGEGWAGSNANNLSSRLHVLASADGLAKRVIVARGGFTVGHWLFETPGSPLAGWASPYYALVRGSTGGSECLSIDDFFSHTSAKGRGRNASAMTLAGSVLGFASGPLFSTVASLSKLYGLRMASATGGNADDYGLFVDLWAGPNSRPSGSTYPATPAPTRELMHHGFLVSPWNGTVPLMAA